MSSPADNLKKIIMKYLAKIVEGIMVGTFKLHIARKEYENIAKEVPSIKKKRISNLRSRYRERLRIKKASPDE